MCVNNTSNRKNSELNVFKKIKFVRKFPNNSLNNLVGMNVYKTLEPD